ncbi:MAG: twin-arginine translocation signal domain-containing protein [Ignavibacteriales bacterium]|nr:twin-arginine translocation signal domain-containing protein [Ignavibacteriales bacterium]
MKKSSRAKSTTRRDFLKKSAFGVASAGLLNTDLLGDMPEKNSAKPQPQEPQATIIRIFCPTPKVCIIDPGSVHVSRGSYVEWKNETGAEVDILMPAHKPNPIMDFRHAPLANGQIFRRQVNPKVADGTYVYSVYSHKTRKSAIAGSEPEMIVP